MPFGSSNKAAEHFVTLFDNNFLPIGLCLYQSLLKHGEPFQLWILCIDELVEHNLGKLHLPYVHLIPLREVEDARLLAVKPQRGRGEYCWTLTPFTPQFVFERCPEAQRVTYLDADVFFFDTPREIFEVFENSGRHVLITEHAPDPRYEKRIQRAGRFCVQFMTFRRTAEAEKVMHWWQARCLEWCYDRVENGKFGDQKYLDQWPTLFASEIYILEQKNKALAPWNVAHFARLASGRIAPVFYHFHGLRLLAPDRLLLYSGYRVGDAATRLYRTYQEHIVNSIAQLSSHGIATPCIPLREDLISRCRRLKQRLFEGEALATLASQPSASV